MHADIEQHDIRIKVSHNDRRISRPFMDAYSIALCLQTFFCICKMMHIIIDNQYSLLLAHKTSVPNVMTYAILSKRSPYQAFFNAVQGRNRSFRIKPVVKITAFDVSTLSV